MEHVHPWLVSTNNGFIKANIIGSEHFSVELSNILKYIFALVRKEDNIADREFLYPMKYTKDNRTKNNVKKAKELFVRGRVGKPALI